MATKYLKAIFLLSILGVLFSGYLTASKLISKTCPFNESCPYLFGYPACVYGLAMYLALLVLSGLILFRAAKSVVKLKKAMVAVSGAGILFSGYFSGKELSCFGSCSYSLLLPTCVYGLVMYIGAFVLSVVALRKR